MEVTAEEGTDAAGGGREGYKGDANGTRLTCSAGEGKRRIQRGEESEQEHNLTPDIPSGTGSGKGWKGKQSWGSRGTGAVAKQK